MKPQKKNKFLTFIFSFMPGAVEMYMGFLKKGASLMAIFLLGIAIPNFLRLYDFNFVFVILVWFYAFFHAHNLAAQKDEVFYELKDGFIWEEFMSNHKVSVPSGAVRKWLSAILIIAGTVILWQNFSNIICSFIPDRLWNYMYPIIEKVPQIVIAFVIIAIGLKLIAGKKEELNNDAE